MDERMRFVTRLREGERVSDLCREFEISRKTAYKFIERFKADGALGLLDRRRVPERVPHRTPEKVKQLIIELRRKQPTWGPKKLQHALQKKHPDVRIPAHSTIGDLLVREKLIVRKRRRKHHAPTEYAWLSTPHAANDVWCMDFKGQFRLGNGEYCYPFTLTDAATRYILACEAFSRIDGKDVQLVLEHVFKTVGMPKAVRFDGGSPFASQGLMRLSRLSAWLVSLGIRLEQIEPASPQQNGRHERMHRTLKADTTRPAAHRLLQQQARFDAWKTTFNYERPHEALGMECPGDLYVASTHPYAEVHPTYPLHDHTLRITGNGSLRFPNTRRGERMYFISEVLAGFDVGAREIDDGQWLVTFCDLDLGILNRVDGTFTPASTSTTTPTSTSIETSEALLAGQHEVTCKKQVVQRTRGRNKQTRTKPRPTDTKSTTSDETQHQTTTLANKSRLRTTQRRRA